MKNKSRFLLLTVGLLLLFCAVPAHAQRLNCTGEWNTATGKTGTFVLFLRQTASEVRGSYSAPNGLNGSDIRVQGSLKGSVRGNVLRFTWREEGSPGGSGQLTFSQDGQSFAGTFGTTRNPEDITGGTWNGTRRTSSSGAWRGRLEVGALSQQTNDRVTAQLQVNSGELGGIRETSLEGNTLRFNLISPVWFIVSPSVDQEIRTCTGTRFDRDHTQTHWV